MRGVHQQVNKERISGACPVGSGQAAEPLESPNTDELIKYFGSSY